MSFDEDTSSSYVQRFRRWRRAWQSSHLPVATSSAGLHAGEQVRVVGRVSPLARPEAATWTRRDAVFFRARVESPEPHAVEDKYGRDTDGTVWSWETRLTLCATQPFWLTSDAGLRVLVLPSPWQCALPEENVSESPHVNHLTPALEALLQRARIRSELFLGTTDKARFYEALVPAGALLSVTGEVTTTTLDGHESYRSGTPSVTALRGTTLAPLMLSPA